MSSFTSLAACAILAAATLPSMAAAQAQNVTGLTGTWASGSGQVLTGLVSICAGV